MIADDRQSTGQAPARADCLSIPELPEDCDNLTAALHYARCGWYVLPVKCSGATAKHPGSVVGTGWQHKSSREPDQIAAWFAATNHGIALHVGRSGGVVIDMDHAELCPVEVLQSLAGAPFQSTRSNDPTRGHYVCAQPPGRMLGNSLGQTLKDNGFEIRGNNGVIIVEPSMHEMAAEGGLYSWRIAGPVPVVPERISACLPVVSEATEAATDKQVEAFLQQHTAESKPSILYGHLKAFQNRVGQLGSRHDAMVSPLTGAMKEAAAGFYSARRAVEALWQPFRAAKTQPFNGKPAMSESAARADFGGILSWAIGQALDAEPEQTRERVAKEMPSQRLSIVSSNPSGQFLGIVPPLIGQPAEPNTITPADNPWGVITGDQFILDQPSNLPAVWGTGNRVVWPEGEGFMIAGTQGVGKTGIAGQLVRELLGLGTGSLFGLPVNDGGEMILYLAMDRPRQIARSMARQFKSDERDILKARLMIRPGPPPADLAQDPTLLARMASELGAKIVFIDSLKDAALGLSDDQVGAAYNRARQLLLAADIQLCDLHHCVKRGANGGPPTSIADIYGSTWLTSGCGSVMLLSGDPGDPIIKLRHVKPAVDEIGPLTLTHDKSTGTFSASAEVDLLSMANRSDPQAPDTAAGVTAREAAAVIFDADKPTSAQTEKARRKLDALTDEGLLFRQDGTKGRGSAARWFPTGRT